MKTRFSRPARVFAHVRSGSASRSIRRAPRSAQRIPSSIPSTMARRFSPPATGTRAAAVLVGLVAHQGGVSVLLTERAASLRCTPARSPFRAADRAL